MRQRYIDYLVHCIIIIIITKDIYRAHVNDKCKEHCGTVY